MATYETRVPRVNGESQRATQERGLSGQPLGLLLSDFFDQARRLIRAEVKLAKVELRQEVKKVQSAGVMVGLGGVLLLIGGIAFMAFACALLALWMPLWLSTLIVTVAFLAVGGGLAAIGLKRFKQVHAPDETIRTLKEDGQWASRTFQSMKSQMRGHA
jgi:hypothetical protein